jgi:hypothetical protein
MSLKTSENILIVFETIIVVVAFAEWTTLGFPEWKPVAAFGLQCRLMGQIPANLACIRDGQAFPLRVRSGHRLPPRYAV